MSIHGRERYQGSEALAHLVLIRQVRISDTIVSAVNARDLHAFLGMKTQFADWVIDQVKRARLVENRDFVTISVSSEKGRPRTDYYVTFDAAKQIGMMCGTDKGFEIRDYFIECEKKFQTAVQAPNFLTMPRSEMLRLMADQAEGKEQLYLENRVQKAKISAQQNQIQELVPKGEFHDAVHEAKGAISIARFAHILGTGQNRKFAWLRGIGLLQPQARPRDRQAAVP